MQKKRIFSLMALLLIVAILISYFVWWKEFLSFAFIQSKKDELLQMISQRPTFAKLIFWLIYFLVAAAAVPAAAALTVLSGFLFGAYTGVLLVISAATIGATVAFLLSRTLLKDYLQSKPIFYEAMQKFEKGFETNGSVYLFFLRMVPIFPFFVVNVVAGLTALSLFRFMAISLLGMLPATVLYVKFGEKLAEIQSLSQVISIDSMVILSLIGLFPVLAKWVWGKFLGKV